jgi:hypothetical protein
MVQFIEGIAVQKIELAGTTDPDRSGIDIKMADFTGLNVRIGSNDTIVHGCQVDGCKRPQKAPVDGRPVDIGIMDGYGVPDEKSFQGFRVVGKIMNQGFN